MFDGSAVIGSGSVSVSIGVLISIGGVGSVKFRAGGVTLGSSAGGGALAVFAGAACIAFVADTPAGAGDGTEVTADEDEVIAPVSRSTSLGCAVLPEKNSEADNAGSREGAGG